MLQLEEPREYRIALHHLGFRPFFLLGGLFAVVSMLLWLWLYHFDAGLLLNAAWTPVVWHAHEMIYGYALAVVAGFLLTAARNWTGVQTLHRTPLLLLTLLWLCARTLPFVPHTQALVMMAVLDMGFDLLASISILYPIVKVKQWKQLGIGLMLILISIANGLFYFAMLYRPDIGTHLGLYSGIYLIIFLVLIMGRRVIPFFIAKGVGYDFVERNRPWVDIGTLLLMAIFLILEATAQLRAAAIVALLLLILQLVRLYDWHTPGLWKKPLLWSLYVAYTWITLGFAMKALSYVAPLTSSMALHAFVYGGIGLLTISMMSRVTLGHTGRNVFEPPAVMQWLFLILLLGAVIRVLMPLIIASWYSLWIGLSQLLWIFSFGLFVLIYSPMLIKPRVDGRYG